MGFFEEIQEALQAKPDYRASYPITRKILNFFSQFQTVIRTEFEFEEVEVADPQSASECCILLKRTLLIPIDNIIVRVIHEQVDETDPEDWHTRDFVRALYQAILEQLSEFYRDELPKHLPIIFSDRQTLSAFFIKERQNVLRMFTFYELRGVITEKVAHHVQQRIVLHKPEGVSILEVACQSDNIRVLRSLIEIGLQYRISNDDLSVLQQITISKGHAELTTFLNSLIAQPFKQKGVKNMISLMGALTSPLAAFGVSGHSQSFADFRDELPDSVSHRLRPVSPVAGGASSLAVTPVGGSQLHEVWQVIVNKDSRNPRTVKLFLDPRKALDVPEHVQHEPQPAPEALPVNTKQGNTLIACIDMDVLQQWQKDGTSSRYRTQEQSMGGCSANQLAKAAGFSTKRLWHLCHLIAYSLGGPDGIMPAFEHERDHKGPQRENNLVCGTVEANAQMLIIEDACKKLISDGFSSVYVKVTPHFVKGFEQYHIAHFVEYTLQDKATDPTRQLTVTFDMLTRRKIAPEEVTALGALFHKIFVAGNETPRTFDLTTPQVRRQVPRRMLGSPMTSADLFSPRSSGKENRALNFEEADDEEAPMSHYKPQRKKSCPNGTQTSKSIVVGGKP